VTGCRDGLFPLKGTNGSASTLLHLGHGCSPTALASLHNPKMQFRQSVTSSQHASTQHRITRPLTSDIEVLGAPSRQGCAPRPTRNPSPMTCGRDCRGNSIRRRIATLDPARRHRLDVRRHCAVADDRSAASYSSAWPWITAKVLRGFPRDDPCCLLTGVAHLPSRAGALAASNRRQTAAR